MTGSRDLPESEKHSVWNAIIHAVGSLTGNGDSDVTIVEGGCPTGADRYAREFVMWANGLDKDIFPYDFHLESYPVTSEQWTTIGKAAGPIRNALMVKTGADVCLAFFYEGAGNRGTSNCAKLAKEAGIQVVTHKIKGDK